MISPTTTHLESRQPERVGDLAALAPLFKDICAFIAVAAFIAVTAIWTPEIAAQIR